MHGCTHTYGYSALSAHTNSVMYHTSTATVGDLDKCGKSLVEDVKVTCYIEMEKSTEHRYWRMQCTWCIGKLNDFHPQVNKIEIL